VTWIRPASDLSAIPRAAFDRISGEYEGFCEHDALDRFDRGSACAFLKEKRASSTVYMMRTASVNVRRYFIDAGHDDPFSTPSQVSYLRRLCDSARPAAEKPVYSSRFIHELIDSLPPNACGERDGAIILLAYAGRLTSEDLHALDPEHVIFSHVGLRARLVASPKRAPLILKRLVDPTHCPVAWLERWFTRIEFQAPGFRRINPGNAAFCDSRASADSISHAILNRIRKLGYLSPSTRGLRGTAVAVAALRGARDSDITGQTGIRTNVTLESWKRRAGVGALVSAAKLGL
jgi:hypothetical protein